MFLADLAACAPSGLTNGKYFVDQLARGVWYLLAPNGDPDPRPLPVASMTSSHDTVLAVNPPSLLASRPFAVYAFGADSATARACTGTCARFRPHGLVAGSLTPSAGSGVTQAGLGTITHPDGTFQVTYFGRPLYFFFAFDQAGKTLSEAITAFGGTFKVVDLRERPGDLPRNTWAMSARSRQDHEQAS